MRHTGHEALIRLTSASDAGETRTDQVADRVYERMGAWRLRILLPARCSKSSPTPGRSEILPWTAPDGPPERSNELNRNIDAHAKHQTIEPCMSPWPAFRCMQHDGKRDMPAEAQTECKHNPFADHMGF